MNSRGLDSALTGNDTEASLTSDGADAADPSQSDAQLRRSLLRATAKSARLSAAVLVLATIYAGWPADRFQGSRPGHSAGDRALALLANLPKVDLKNQPKAPPSSPPRPSPLH